MAQVPSPAEAKLRAYGVSASKTVFSVDAVGSEGSKASSGRSDWQLQSARRTVNNSAKIRFFMVKYLLFPWIKYTIDKGEKSRGARKKIKNEELRKRRAFYGINIKKGMDICRNL